MSVLRNLESKLAGLVEGTFSRAFRSEVRPVEIARKLAREMELHKTQSLSRSYAPNRYQVFLSSRDRQRFADLEGEIVEELTGYLLEHARAEGLQFPSRPEITFATDERLGLGEFGIQTQLVHDRQAPGREPEDSVDESPARRGQPPAADEEESAGRTMVYSAGQALGEPLDQRRLARRAVLIDQDNPGRRLALGRGGATIGRSRRCDVVLADANVSREHAELRPDGGGWVVVDLGSTNGTRLNGREISGEHPLRSGDAVEFGNTRMTFELE